MIPGIVAGGLNRRIYIENLAPLGLDKKTKYYRFIEDHAYSYGPYTLGETPSLNNLRVWEAYQDQDQDQIILKNSFEEHVVVENVVERLNNLSFTFDQNGFPLVVWEINKQIYLRWYDPVVSDIVVSNIGDGHSPFIALETFNENLKPTRNILLVYINSNKQLVHRYQTDRWSEEFLIKNDVIDIIGFGSTPHNNIKIVYVNDKNVQDEFVIETIATERLGLYEFDTLYARNIIGDVSEIRYKDSTTSLDTVELPITMELVSTTSEIGGFFTYENVSYNAVELPMTMEVLSCDSDFKVKEIGWHRLYPEDIATNDIEVIPEIVSIGIRNSSIVSTPIDIADNDIEVIPEIQNFDISPGYVHPENESRYSQWSWMNKNSNIALSNDRITSLINPTQSSVDGIVKSVVSRSTYKKYVELKIDALDPLNNCSVGIARSIATIDSLVGRTADTWELFADGNSVHSGVSATTAPYQQGDVIGIAIDIEAGKLWWSINGVWLNGGDPENGTNPFYTNLDVVNFNIISAPISNNTRISLHVPDTSWTHTVPVGFESWLENTIVSISISGDTVGGANFETYNSHLNILNAIGNVEWSIICRESPEILMYLSDTSEQLWFKDYNIEYPITIFGGVKPYSSIDLIEGVLPNGVNINLNSPRLEITAEPDEVSSGEVVYKVTDSTGKYGFTTIRYTIGEIGITSDHLAEYDKEFVTINLTTVLSGTIQWGIAKGTMPDGWVLNSSTNDTNTITGTSTEYGIFNFVLSANNGINTVYLPVTVTIISMGAYNFDLNVEYVTVDPENMNFNLDVIW